MMEAELSGYEYFYQFSTWTYFLKFIRLDWLEPCDEVRLEDLELIDAADKEVKRQMDEEESNESQKKLKI